MSRLFMAIPLPEDVKEHIQRLIPEQHLKGVRWIPSENLHITLYFIGEAEENQIPQLAKKINGIAREASPFVLDFKQVLVKRKQGSPAMVWIELYSSTPFLNLSREIAGIFNETQKAPRPHITAARIRNKKIRENQLLVNADKVSEQQLRVSVDEIQLWKSERKPEGAVYHLLNRFYLGKHN